MTPIETCSELKHPIGPCSKILIFGFDSAEASQIRRIKSLMALGHDVHAFTMRRGDKSQPFDTEFPNTHLYWTDHEKLLKRAFVVAGSIVKMTGYREKLRSADVILARNLDMLAIAWAARFLANATNVPLVYECLDIHKSMTGDGQKSKALRRAERWLLARCQMLVTSSPAYLTEYFEALQGYAGPSMLWENKIVPSAALPDRSIIPPVPDTGKLRLGWVGSIRCRPSLLLLRDLARRLGDEIEIHIHGKVHEHALPDFQSLISGTPNIDYHGPYVYPSELPCVYETCDLVWNIDLWLRGGNSDWALSNRLYEASWCGRPSIGLKGTAIGSYIDDHDLGWTLKGETPEECERLLKFLSRSYLVTQSNKLLARAESEFVSDGSELQAVIDELVGASKKRATTGSHHVT